MTSSISNNVPVIPAALPVTPEVQDKITAKSQSQQKVATDTPRYIENKTTKDITDAAKVAEKKAQSGVVENILVASAESGVAQNNVGIRLPTRTIEPGKLTADLTVISERVASAVASDYRTENSSAKESKTAIAAEDMSVQTGAAKRASSFSDIVTGSMSNKSYIEKGGAEKSAEARNANGNLLNETAETGYHFSIVDLNEGYTGKSGAIFNNLIKAFLVAEQSERDMQVRSVKMARDSAIASGNNIVRSAHETRSQAAANFGTSMAMSGVAAGGSIKSLSKQNRSLNSYDRNSSVFNKKNGGLQTTKDAHKTVNDRDTLGKQNKNVLNEQSKESSRVSSEQTRNHQRKINNAQKIQQGAYVLQNNAASLGNLSGQGYAIESSEYQRKAKLNDSEERIQNSRADTEQRNVQIMHEAVQELLKVAESEATRRAQTASSLTLKG